jgi:hypothetical protein
MWTKQDSELMQNYRHDDRNFLQRIKCGLTHGRYRRFLPYIWPVAFLVCSKCKIMKAFEYE